MLGILTEIGLIESLKLTIHMNAVVGTVFPNN